MASLSSTISTPKRTPGERLILEGAMPSMVAAISRTQPSHLVYGGDLLSPRVTDRPMQSQPGSTAHGPSKPSHFGVDDLVLVSAERLEATKRYRRSATGTDLADLAKGLVGVRGDREMEIPSLARSSRDDKVIIREQRG
ncbi:MAG: hypothetical protein ACREMY_03200 [bacterium]